MKAVHFVLQGKGGVGKSFVATLLYQYLSINNQVVGFDTDPVNASFAQYKSLEVQTVPILTDDNNIDTSRFDSLIELVLDDNQHVAVVDNGAATFVPLMSYMYETDAISMLVSMGVKVFFHVPLVGGKAKADTIKGLNDVLARWGEEAQVVVWLNNFQGRFEEEVSFKDTTLYSQHKSSIAGVINIAKRNEDTFGKDIREMTEQNLTFDEVLTSSSFSIMPKHRLKMVRDDVFNQLNEINWEEEHEVVE